MNRPDRGQVVAAILLAILGFAAVTQMRVTNTGTDYATLREQDLVEVFSGLTGASERARDEIERLERTQRNLETETNSRAAALEAAQKRMETLEILAGSVPVRGPGIRVTVTEGDDQASIGSLLDMVQELRTAGAEAIEFNNTLRVGAQSSFEDATGGIELDGEHLVSPYVIEAIGEPHTLSTGMTFASGPVDTLKNTDGATVQIDELDDVEIASVREQPRLIRANPDSDD